MDHPALQRSAGFGRIFGLDPRIAFLMFIVDLMLFGSEALSLGLLIPVGVVVGVVLGYVTARAQITWYGDDRESAIIKGIIVGLLTAIPSPLPAVVYVPSALVGWIDLLRRRRVSRELQRLS
ncbi:MAG: hypothetical protein ABSF94_05600 [Steroidobacteraceae bacterium]|jgi:hypothetical protein